MTRLFIRFYLGVLFVLVMAWFIQAYVFRGRTDAENARVIESALGGGVRLAREELRRAGPADRRMALEEIRQRFDFPIVIAPVSSFPEWASDRIADGDEVILFGEQDALYLLSSVPDSDDGLKFGPLPQFVGPDRTEVMTGLGLVLLLAAAAIALLLRPVAKQFRLIERAARNFAHGDFTARVDAKSMTSATTLATAFNNMAGRTEVLLKTQRELLQAVSHELRTPLSRIHFAIDLIRTAETEQQRETRLQSLETAATDLDELVGELLRYVRLESNEPTIDRTDVDLLPIVETIFEKHSPLHPETQFVIGSAIKDASVVIHADRAALERAIGNLVENAARYGGSKVVVDAGVLPGATVLDVDDDGPGIPEADRERAFEPFVSLNDAVHGAGLGLALVRRIAARHGGRAEILDSPSGGCRVRTFWPNANHESQQK